MLELNDIQADRICEILNVRFHHYEKAQYKDDPYNDEDPQYYFYSESVAPSVFKVNRSTGEFKWDHFRELSFTLMGDIFGEKILNLLKDDGDEKIKSKIDENSNRFSENNLLKEKVKEYLILENIL